MRTITIIAVLARFPIAVLVSLVIKSLYRHTITLSLYYLVRYAYTYRFLKYLG